MLEAEANEYLKATISACEGCFFLPDYLMEDAFSDAGRSSADALEEFMPAPLYTE